MDLSLPSSFSFLIQSGLPSQGIVRPTFWDYLPPSVRHPWKCLRRQIQRFFPGDFKPSQADNKNCHQRRLLRKVVLNDKQGFPEYYHGGKVESVCRDRNGRCQGTEVEGGKQALPFTHWEGRHGIARGNKAGVWTGDILWGASLCTVQRGLGLYLISHGKGRKGGMKTGQGQLFILKL